MENVKADLIKFLDMIIRLKSGHKDFKYSGIEDFVRQNGEFNTSQKYPEKYIKYRGQKKECFMNAYQLSQRFPELRYVEGFAMSESIPIAIHHAWCIDQKSNVIDPTWDDQHESVYYGVEFNQNYILKIILSTHHYGIIDNVSDKFPLMRGAEGHKKKDFGYE